MQVKPVAPPVDMPPMPARMAALPMQDGYPVPWFTARVGDRYDFRVVDYKKFKPAFKKNKCWVCGQKLGAYLSFVIGPMCTINRISSEPPSHRECCEWALKVCPFLLNRQTYRNSSDLPDNLKGPAGIHNDRQPGVAVLWTTKRFKAEQISNGILFELGDPTDVTWHYQGRSATREESLKSFNSGYEFLLRMAQKHDGEAGVRDLRRRRERALYLLPEL